MQIRRRRAGGMLGLLIEELFGRLRQPRFDTGIDPAVLGFDPATAGQQVVVLDDLPAFLVPLTQLLDQFEVLRIDMDTHIAGAHGQQLQSFAQNLTNLTGVDQKVTLDDLFGQLADQRNHGVLQVAILLGNGIEQLRHQALPTLEPRRQGCRRFAPGLELVGVKSIRLPSTDAYVVGLLTNRYQLVKGQRLALLTRYIFAMRTLFG